MNIETNFKSAVKIQGAPKIKKAFNPGLGKFIRRTLTNLSKRPTRVTAPVFFGGNMQVVLPEVISEAIYTYGYFDEEVSETIIEQVKSGDVAIDVGAHFGYFTRLMSKLVGPKGNVYSFEPTPSTFEVLSENTTGINNVQIFNFAVGASEGTAQITDYGLRYCAWNTLTGTSKYPEKIDDSLSFKRDVKVVALDEFLQDRAIVPDFIKIDAENFEEQVISGLVDTIDRYRPKLLLETGASTLFAREKLLNKGYGAWARVDHRLQNVTDTLEKAQREFKDILYLPE